MKKRRYSNTITLFILFTIGIANYSNFSEAFGVGQISWRDNSAASASVLPVSFTFGERGTAPSSTDGGDIRLLSQRYNEDEFSSEIVGEIENNGTEPVKFVKVAVTFHDSSGNIVGTEETYADPSDLSPGMKAPFKIFLTNDAIIDETATYAFTISWDNPDGSTGVTTVSDQSVGQTSGGGVEDEGTDSDSDEDDNNDGDENADELRSKLFE